ncbi:MAG: hypothetical protein FWE95_08520, partial [Planctomycetaceae bacterium]|nr:hypothetical protein [Planctomycetaceae bacterium]
SRTNGEVRLQAMLQATLEKHFSVEKCLKKPKKNPLILTENHVFIGAYPNELKAYLNVKTPEQELAMQTKIREAEQRAFTAEVKASIMQAGANPDYIDDITALVTARGIDSDTLSETVEAVKTKYPTFFQSKEPEKQAGQRGTGSPMKAGGGGVKQQDDDPGKRLAERRNQNAVKSSPWGQS